MKNINKQIYSESLIYILIGVSCAIVFFTIYGVKILNPNYTDWLLVGGDLTQHYLGWKAFRMSEWHALPGMIDTLAYPNQTSVIFTDSIPIFAIFFKVLSFLLPQDFQYFGLWGLGCFFLQGIMAARIIRNFSDNKVAVVLSSVLFAYMPVMLFRMFEHTSLAGQWILLLGLEPIFLDYKYKENNKIYRTVICMGILSASVHMYYVLMSGIILLGICILDVLNHKRLRRVIYMGISYLFSVVIVVKILGGFDSDMQASNGGLGRYSLNGNALLNPQGWSAFLRDLPLYGDGQYEGFGYLGMGCIVLVLLATGTLVLKNTRVFLRNHWKKIMVLLVVIFVSIFIALSPVVTFNNHMLISLKLPFALSELWAVFRSSGRIIWIAIYIIALCSCILLCKIMNRRVLILTFLFALVVQILDIHEVLIAKNRRFTTELTYDSQMNCEDFWTQIARNKDIKNIVYCSSVERSLMYSITDWATSNGKTVSDFYFARSISHLVFESRERALTELSPENLYIFMEADVKECDKYDLFYYNVDGLIVGYVLPIAGFGEIERF